MPSELPGVTAIDIGNKNVATGKNDIESTSTGLKKKVTLGLLLVLLIAAVGSTAAAVVVILGKDNQVAAPPEEAAADAPQVISVTVNAPGDSNTIFKSAVERLPSARRFHLIVQYKSTADDDPLCTHLIHVDGVETKFIFAASPRSSAPTASRRKWARPPTRSQPMPSSISSEVAKATTSQCLPPTRQAS